MSKFAYYEQKSNEHGAVHMTIGLLPAESAMHIRNVDDRRCKVGRVRRPDFSTGWWTLRIRDVRD